MNSNHWDKFYLTKKVDIETPSSFAEWCIPFFAKGSVVELGCGNGRDLRFFRMYNKSAHGVDASFEDKNIKRQDVNKYMDKVSSPDHVYTRFFWHAIDRATQLRILDWTKNAIYIEARTIEDGKLDHVYKDHERNYVDITQLIKDLKQAGFQIMHFEEGRGYSKYKTEDPHLFRLIAKK